MAETLRKSFQDAADALGTLLNNRELIAEIDRTADLLGACISSGGKIMLCGNGGSLCDAVHFAEELTGRFRADRRPLPAIACADAGHITCTANDYGFEHVFSRWVEALGKPDDVLIVLSTSGNSANIVRSLAAAKHARMKTVSLLGKSGGALRGACDAEIIVPGATSDRIQELHMLILHAWVEGIEARVLP